MTDLDLRTTLHRVADGSTPLPVADDLWQRGQAARRRGHAYVLAAVLVVVTSIGATFALVDGDREARTASGEVPGGAIPSVITDAGSVPFETDLPTERMSVAFLSNGAAITLIGAEDGRYHLYAPETLELAPSGAALALSPDGRRLAWTTTDRIAFADLESGEVTTFAHNTGRGADVAEMVWQPDSVHLLWRGEESGEAAAGIIDITGPSEEAGDAGRFRFSHRGVPSPSGEVIALRSDGREVDAAPFLRVPADLGDTRGERVTRPLPTDLYPNGAVVTPLGWASDDLVVATIDPPQSDVVERPRLAVLTAPDRPDAVFREFLPELPPVDSLSIAVDLIPDLTGDLDQELTHDFAADSQPQEERDVSWIIGLGVAAAVGVLLGLRWLWRRYLLG